MGFVKVNAKEDTTSTREFGISGFPTVVLFGKDGKEIDRIVGYEPPAEFLNTITLYKQGKETLSDYLKRYNDHPDSIELIYNIGDKYEGRSMYDSAALYYELILKKDADNKYGYTDKAIHSYAFIKYRRKDFKGAIDSERELIDKFPESELYAEAYGYIPWFYSKWAKYAEKNGNKGETKVLKSKAIKYYQDFIKKFPKNEDVDWAKKQIEKLKES